LKVETFPLTLLLAALVLAGPAAPVFGQTPPRLEVEAPESLAHVETRIRSFDARQLVGIMELAGLEDPGAPIQVVVVPEHTPLARNTPEWIAGFAHPASDTVVLFPARSPSYPDDTLEDLLHHEIAHVLITRAAAGRPVPRWFDEGLALAAERGWGFGDRTRALVEMAFGPRVSLDELDGLFRGDRGSMRRAYLYAGAFVRDLLQRHGRGFPGEVLAFLAQGEPFDRAFLRATGEPPRAAFDAFWDRQTFWTRWMPLLTSPYLLWLIASLLVLYAFKRRRDRRAERRRRWEEEERLEAMRWQRDDETIH
jgi:hypothetical protein